MKKPKVKASFDSLAAVFKELDARIPSNATRLNKLEEELNQTPLNHNKARLIAKEMAVAKVARDDVQVYRLHVLSRKHIKMPGNSK